MSRVIITNIKMLVLVILKKIGNVGKEKSSSCLKKGLYTEDKGRA